jgi:hypothetical protein
MKKRQRKRYWHCSFAVYDQYLAVPWRFTDTVTDEHPFLVLKANNQEDAGTKLWTLLAWRPITRAEYVLHGEHLP